MEHNTASPTDEIVDLAALLAIPTDDKPPVPPPAPEPAPLPAATSPGDASKVPTPGEPVTLKDVMSPDDAADNMINMIDGIQSLILSGIYTAKAIYALPKADREKVKQASKKPVAERTAEDIHLLATKKKIFENYQKKSDSTNFTDKEILRLKKPAKALVIQKNIQVSPGLAFGFILADIVIDRIIDVALDD